MKNGWQSKILGDICDFEGGSQPPKSEFVYEEKPGYVRFLQIRDFASDKNITYIPESKKNRLCKQDDILIGRYGASVGKILTDKAGAYNVALMKTIPRLDVLEWSWFYYYLISDGFQSQLLNVADRSAQAGFSKDIYNFPVPVPPLPEQHRIVAILDKAFDGIATAKANAEKNLQNARALFESHLQAVFSRRGKVWSTNKKPLSELCELIVDCEHKTAPTQDEGIPSIRTPNIGKGKLLLDGVYRVSEETYKEWSRRAEPQPGDLILAREAPAGNVAVIPENLKVCLGQRTVLIRPNNAVFQSKFLAMMLLQPAMQQKLLAHSRGATVQHVNMKDIRALQIESIPSLSEQMEIVSVVDKMTEESGRLETICQQKIAALDELKKSLLHQAFSGQL